MLRHLKRFSVVVGALVLVLGTISIGPDGYAKKKKKAIWVLIDGPRAGHTLKADRGTDTVKDKHGTEGRIALAEPGCDARHFHGTLEGAPDPNANGCGWGRTIKVGSVTDLFNDVRGAVLDEELALALANQEPLDRTTSIASFCQGASEALRRAVSKVQELRAQGKITQQLADAIVDPLSVASRLDDTCVTEAKKDDPSGAEIRRLLNEASVKKRDAIKLIVDNKLAIDPKKDPDNE